MAENLNYNNGSKCGDGSVLSDANTITCDAYGRLYNFSTARSACTPGWHLPSKDEWDVLLTTVDGTRNAGINLKAISKRASLNDMELPIIMPALPDVGNEGTKLKAISGWYSYNSGVPLGTDNYGFSALPGGNGNTTHYNYFSGVGYSGSWWSSSAAYESVNFLNINYDREGIISSNASQYDYFISIRCVRD